MDTNMKYLDGIEIRASKIQGTGVFAIRNFKVGESVYESKRGKIIRKDELQSLPESERNHTEPDDRETFEIIPEPARFINHSCDPNIVEKVDRNTRIGYALRPINDGEEITTDYRIRAFDDWQMKCECGSEKCEGMVKGNFFALSPELQRKYLPYANRFIQEEYRSRNQ